MYYTSIWGNGSVTALGGDSNDFGGEGGGGRIKIFFYKWNIKYYYEIHVTHW